MAFFDQIKDMAKAAAVKSEEFAKTVGKKAEAAMDMQKLSSDIDKKEHYIKDNYMQMGMEIYQKAAAGEEIPAYLLEYCKLIDATQAEIEELQTKIEMIKQAEFGASPAKVPCPHCGVEILSTSKFCPECGASLKQEKVSSENAEKQAAAKVNDEAVTEEAVVAETAETEVEKTEQEAAKESVMESEAEKDAEPAAKEAGPKEAAAESETVLQAETVEAAKEAEPMLDVANEPKAHVSEDAITDAEIVEPAVAGTNDNLAEVKAANEKAAADRKEL